MRRSGVPGYGSWFTRRELAGGGAFTDLGAHLVDLVMWLLDFPPVKNISAQFAAMLGPKRSGLGDWGVHAKQGAFDVEDFASVRVETEDGCVTNFETSWAYFGPDESRVQVLGTEAGVDINSGSRTKDSPVSVYAPLDGNIKQIFRELPELSALESTMSDREWILSMQQFVDACEGRPAIATGAEALRSVEILERAYAEGMKSTVLSQF
jgi:predicted dehydrogenase